MKNKQHYKHGNSGRRWAVKSARGFIALLRRRVTVK